MTREQNVDHILDSWFTDGPTHLPDRAVAAIVDQLEDVHQRGALGLPGRLSMPRIIPALGGAVVVVLIAALAINFLSSRHGPGATTSPSPSPKLLARGDFFMGDDRAIQLEASGQGSSVTGRMTVSDQVSDPEIDAVFTVELQCTRTTADGVLMIGGITTEGNGVSPEGAWAAIVLEPGSPVNGYVLSQRGGPASNAASCLAYLDEKVPVRGGFPGLTPVEGTLELGPAVQPGGNSE